MKKVLFGLMMVFGGCVPALADHTYIMKGENITRGTLPNARLDPSSVTLQGNSLTFSTVAAGVQSLTDRFNIRNSTNDSQNTKFQNFRTSDGVTVEGFKAQFSTNNSEHELFKAWFATNTLENTLIANFFSTFSVLNDSQNLWLSSNVVDHDRFKEWFATNTLENTLIANFFSSNSVLNDNQNLWLSSQTAEVTKVSNFSSSNSVLNDNQNLWLSSQTAEVAKVSNFSSSNSVLNDSQNLWLSSANAQSTIFVNFRSTTDASLVPATSYKMAQVYLSSSGALSTQGDLQGSYTTNFINALEMIGAAGLTESTTRQGTIYMGPGHFFIAHATIPAGVTVICNASTTIKPVGTTANIFTIYGSLKGDGVIDVENAAFSGTLLRIVGTTTNKYVKIDVKNAGNMPNVVNHGIYHIKNASNVVVDGNVQDWSGAGQDQIFGGLANIVKSSNVWFNVNSKNMAAATTGKQGIYLEASDNIHITGNHINIGGRFMTFKENGSIYIENGDYYINQAYGTGLFWIANVNGGLTSTHTVFNNLNIYHNVADADPIIGMLSAAGQLENLVITNNRAYGLNATVPVFVTVAAGVLKTIGMNNVIYRMTGISDNGTGTDWTGNNNFINGISQ